MVVGNSERDKVKSYQFVGCHRAYEHLEAVTRGRTVAPIHRTVFRSVRDRAQEHEVVVARSRDVLELGRRHG